MQTTHTHTRRAPDQSHQLGVYHLSETLLLLACRDGVRISPAAATASRDAAMCADRELELRIAAALPLRSSSVLAFHRRQGLSRLELKPHSVFCCRLARGCRDVDPEGAEDASVSRSVNWEHMEALAASVGARVAVSRQAVALVRLELVICAELSNVCEHKLLERAQRELRKQLEVGSADL